MADRPSNPPPSVYRHDRGLRDRMVRHVAAFDRLEQGEHDLKQAAVGVTVAPGPNGDAVFLLTRRAAGMRRHSGQWALPGGRVDPGESIEQAALRELAEELHLHLPAQSVLGRLDDYPTRSGYKVALVVLWADSLAGLKPNPGEVASVDYVPLAELDRPDAPTFISISQSERPVIQMPIWDRLVHAPTAALIYQFREVALHGRATRVDGMEQPVFAWR